MSNDSSGSEKKLHIDEDWKSQVEAEKAAAEEAASEGKTPEPAEENQAENQAPPLPPPTLTLLASTIYWQGAIAMGLLPNPMSDKSEPRPEQARHAIDMLAMLQQKTEGNRTPDESEELEEMLHQLRMAFVSLQS